MSEPAHGRSEHRLVPIVPVDDDALETGGGGKIEAFRGLAGCILFYPNQTLPLMEMQKWPEDTYSQ